VQRKQRPNKLLRADDTNIVVSVNERSERDLIKRFGALDIDWTVIEKQLHIWGRLFLVGKKLTVKISFNYKETDPVSSTSVRQGSKRGYSQYMLSERDT
jgi:hypothetical protein